MFPCTTPIVVPLAVFNQFPLFLVLSKTINSAAAINNVLPFQFDFAVRSKFSGKALSSKPGQAIGILLGG